LPSAPHVVGVQPHTIDVCIGSPPQVLGSVQSAFDWHPHWPCALQYSVIVPDIPHAMVVTFGLMFATTFPPEQVSVMHLLPELGGSLSSTTVW
jgi:hypothetical protein